MSDFLNRLDVRIRDFKQDHNIEFNSDDDKFLDELVELATAEADTSDFESNIDQLQDEITDLENEVSSLEREVDEKDKEIAELQDKIEELES